MANFSVATEEYAGKDAPAHVEWHNVTLWNHHAEFAGQHVDKGDLVRVDGAIRKEEYIDKENVRRTNVKIQGKNLMLLQKKGGAAPAEPEPSSMKNTMAPTSRVDLLERKRLETGEFEVRAANATEQPGELPF